MGTRFKFTTKTKIGGNTIQLKHKGLWLGKSDAKNITLMVSRARACLSSTIAAISSGTQDTGFANTYFVGVPTPAEWLAISAKLELTYGGLRSDVTLKLGADGNFGVVRPTVTNSSNPAAVIDEDGDYVDYTTATLHVSKKRMLKSAELGIITIIHEASHKYANSFDHDDRGYREKDDSDWWEPGLTHAEAINNADSLAYFVYRQGASMGA